MKLKTLLLSLLLFGISASSFADFNDGLNAYKKGVYKTAFNEWKPLAEQGDADAQQKLGDMYRSGKGLPRDNKEAIKWHTRAAEQGNAWSQFQLGAMYENGEGVPKNIKESIRWHKKAAENNRWESAFILGMKYEFGDDGLLRNYKEAVKWYGIAASLDDAESQLSLGVFYAYGKGVPKDLSKAKYWIKKAYEGGGLWSQERKDYAEEIWNEFNLWEH
jgi:TPR repeat protein